MIIQSGPKGITAKATIAATMITAGASRYTALSTCDGMICSCACGTHYHLEQSDCADEPDEEPLACFTTIDRCRTCQAPTSLDERLLPDPATLGFGEATTS